MEHGLPAECCRMAKCWFVERAIDLKHRGMGKSDRELEPSTASLIYVSVALVQSPRGVTATYFSSLVRQTADDKRRVEGVHDQRLMSPLVM
jgi:hypothetical protein